MDQTTLSDTHTLSLSLCHLLPPPPLSSEHRRIKAVKLTYHNEAHLAHGLLVVIVHLADEGIAQVHSDTLDRLVLAGGAEDAEQELVHAAVLELQLLGDAEVAEGQTAVPLHLGQGGRQAEHVQGQTWDRAPDQMPPRAGEILWKRKLLGLLDGVFGHSPH